MTTHYCHTLEEALRRTKAAGREPDCHYGGITLKSGKTGFAVYWEGKVVVRFSVMKENGPKTKKETSSRAGLNPTSSCGMVSKCKGTN